MQKYSAPAAASTKQRVTHQVIRSHAVYDGQTRLGTIEQVGNEYIARDNRGTALGSFDTAIEASRAVGMAASRGGPP